MSRRQWLHRLIDPVSSARIAVVMYSTPNILDYAGLAARINQRYAEQHGYDFVHYVGSGNAPLPAWDKVTAIRELLPRYDAIFFIDSDAIFNEHAKPLDFLLQDKADFAACSDHPNGPYLANAGALFIRNTPWTRDLVDRWWSMRQDPIYHSWAYEQSALDHLLRTETSGRHRIYPATKFNSIAHEIAEGRRDTFVLHFMAISNEERRIALREQLRALDARQAHRSESPFAPTRTAHFAGPRFTGVPASQAVTRATPQSPSRR